MLDLIYYASFLVTALVVLALLAVARAAIRRGGDEKTWTNYFMFGAILAGMVSGCLLFHAVLWSFDAAGHRLNVGHGEVIVAAPFFNLVLGVVLAILGRVLLRWRPIAW
ncbi:hypothetical protein [Massilia aerilata]|uniref:Uncharacterized protein n=1 Tax=Massilia aerilata TaxID=453817 RepID=A0ABW0RVQ8_9BURK